MREPSVPSTVGELSSATGPRFALGCDGQEWVRLAADHFTVKEPMVDEETGYLTLLVSPKKLTPEAQTALFSPGASSTSSRCSSSFSCARTADSCRVQWGEVHMEKHETVAVGVLLGLVVVENAEQELSSLLLHNAEHQEVENKPAVAELDFLSDDEPEEVGGCFIYDWSRSKGYSAADYGRKAFWMLKQGAVAGGGYLTSTTSKNKKRKSDEQRDDAAGVIVDEEKRKLLEEEKQKQERRMQNEAVRAKYGRGSPKRRKGAGNGARGKEDFNFF